MVPGRSEDYPRGKIIGGSSSTNSCLALRGLPEDYDEWAANGNSDWSWQDVLPAFIRLEDDPLIAPELHGRGGPTPIRRYAASELNPAQSAFLTICGNLGFPAVSDHNDPAATGAGTGPWNMRPDNTRVSTAIAYLLAARGRTNLAIRSDCLVDRVIFKGTRAVGVVAQDRDQSETFYGRRVALCGGSIGSPAILLRSGIGPADDLKVLGIKPVIPLNGVGRNLVDHAGIGVNWHSPAEVVGAHMPYVQVLLRHTSQGSAFRNDMQVMPLQARSQPALRLKAQLMKPLSRGTLRLRSADARVQPEIRLNLAQHNADRRRLRNGLKLLGNFIRQPEFMRLGSQAVVLDDLESMSGSEFARLVYQEDWADAYIQRAVRHYVHPVGTARMGAADDPDAVVDQHGRVHGLIGLRVVDASIMPTIPRANTHLTCVMIGERIAEWMRDEDN